MIKYNDGGNNLNWYDKAIILKNKYKYTSYY